jgi:hypothetical protein
MCCQARADAQFATVAEVYLGAAACTTCKHERRREKAGKQCTHVAMEVPLMVLYALFSQEEKMFTPGAQMSTQLPLLEKPAFQSLESVAPTVIAVGADAAQGKGAEKSVKKGAQAGGVVWHWVQTLQGRRAQAGGGAQTWDVRSCACACPQHVAGNPTI